jgi:hypothetical protein
VSSDDVANRRTAEFFKVHIRLVREGFISARRLDADKCEILKRVVLGAVKAVYYLFLTTSFAASPYFIGVLLVPRPATAQKMINFDYGVYRTRSDRNEELELLVQEAGHISKPDT